VVFAAPRAGTVTCWLPSRALPPIAAEEGGTSSARPLGGSQGESRDRAASRAEKVRGVGGGTEDEHLVTLS